MGKTLMYKEADGYGWTKSSVYSAKEVIEIKDDPSAKKITRPKVSVPSPFARFELVQKAFSNVALLGKDADIRDRVLVYHALDVMQLWFEGGKGIQIVHWSKQVAIKELKESKIPGHRLYGKALELYMRQENYGFNGDDVDISILTYHGDPLGCTSPTSIFMATPNFNEFQNLTVEGDYRLFANARMLHERDEAFIEYVFRQANSMNIGDGNPLADFKNYLEQQKQIIRTNNAALYSRLNQMDCQASDMDSEYTKSDIQVLGYPIYQRRQEDQQQQIRNESDFVINSEKSTHKPLILSNNGAYNNWTYISKSKLFNNQIHKIEDYSKTNKDQKRTRLPGTDIEYEDGWLCENDFLSNVMVMLPYPLDKKHFFDGNIVKAGKYNYLLPIKPKYFDFFGFDTLYDPLGRKDKCGAEPIFKIEEEKVRDEIKSATVTLLIPVRNGKTVKLRKVYRFESDTNEGLMTFPEEKSQAVGKLVECPIALNIFPFFRLDSNNYYDIQVLRAGFGWDAFNVKLIAASNCATPNRDDSSIHQQEQRVMNKEVKRSKNATIYSLKESFDYLRIQITDGTRVHESVLIPKWGESYRGSTKFRFSFDFGTTNSYIAVQNLSSPNDQYDDLKLRKSIVSTLDQKLKANKEYAEDMTTINQLDVPMRQEFLPAEIGTTYSFPLRTVVLRNSALDPSTTPEALLHVNIPFVYGKEDYGQANIPVPNIKWSNDSEGQKLSNAFIEELVLLARAYALENGGDLKECSMIWTYPLSMNGGNVSDFEDQWKKYYKKYFYNSEDAANDKIKHISESVAPLLYYRTKPGTLYDMTLSVDIGGGTCDVVVQLKEDQIKLCSFRFAADVIFGAGNACDNEMIKTHYQHFMKLLSSMGSDESRKVGEMLKKMCESGLSSTEASTFLFALEKHPALTTIDTDDKSYNVRLKKDRLRKIIFIYFYGAIIYYLTRMLCDLGYEKPERILFSGTGSKLLNIIGSDGSLRELTTGFIEKFSDGQFKYGGKSIEIKIEREQPKQLTAKGALCDSNDKICSEFAKPSQVRKNIIHDQLIKDGDEPRKVIYDDLRKDAICNDDIRNAVVNKVEQFNRAFIECISELDFNEEHGCDENGLNKFVKLINDCDNLRARLDRILYDNFQKKIENGGDDEFEDVLFFYPVKHLIQNDLISKIKL